MNRSEGAKKVGPPQKNSLDPPQTPRIRDKIKKPFLKFVLVLTNESHFTFLKTKNSRI